ncbi:TonB-dependent receptor [Perlucidibaca piscinae]|uniref:TonB-dependent receptor n=1 Tax=Perlucidibaca piscinae TaxID=392589 RepID=UPI0003B5A64C|nr:TonB-dependent receptor [Perlucidibaca piscinae]
MKYLPFTLAPLALGISLIASANDVPVDDTLPDIVVSASRLTEQAGAQSLRVISREQIETSTAQTLPDLLRQVPGLQVRSLFGVNSSEAIVDLGAFGPAAAQNTLILIDGRRQNDIDSSATDIGALSLDQVERIEILPGSGGVLYGDGAVGGTINIITRDQRINRTRITLGAGSYDTEEAQLLSQFAASRIAGQTFIKHSRSDGYRDNSQANRIEAGSKLQLDLTERQSLYGSFQASRQDTGLPGFRSVTAREDQLNDSPREASSQLDYADTERLQGTVGWRAVLRPDTTLVLEAAHRQKQQRALFVDPFFSRYIDTRLQTTSLSPRLEQQARLANWSGPLTIGVDLQLSDYDSDRKADENADAIHRLNITSRNQSIYAHQTLRNGNTSVTLGVRETRARLRARDRYDESADPFGGGDAKAAPYNATLKASLYEAAVGQQISPQTQVGLGIARNVRLPTVDDLFEGFGLGFPGFSDPRAFSPLRPQVGKNLTAYAQTRAGKTDIRLDAFHHRLRNEIYFSNETFTNDNIDPTRREGISLSVGAPLTGATRLDASTTFQRARFSAGANKGNDVPLVARHLAQLQLTHDLNARWQLAVSSNYTGSRHFDNDDENSFGRRAPVMVRSDAAIRYRQGNWRVTGTVRNLTDERDQYDYAASSGLPFGTLVMNPWGTSEGKYNAYPLPGRNLLVNIEYTF